MNFAEYRECSIKDVLQPITEKHYLKRRPPCSYAFGAWIYGELVAVITYGVPPSRHMQKSVCPTDPNKVIELNRLWVSDCRPRNFASNFISWTLKHLPPLLIASYADTAAGHDGTVYRAANFYYSGWTDQDRKTPRFDYVVTGKHSRDAFRGKQEFTRVRRKPKIKYWIASGDRREKRQLEQLCGWPKVPWNGGPYA